MEKGRRQSSANLKELPMAYTIQRRKSSVDVPHARRCSIVGLLKKPSKRTGKITHESLKTLDGVGLIQYDEEYNIIRIHKTIQRAVRASMSIPRNSQYANDTVELLAVLGHSSPVANNVEKTIVNQFSKLPPWYIKIADLVHHGECALNALEELQPECVPFGSVQLSTQCGRFFYWQEYMICYHRYLPYTNVHPGNEPNTLHHVGSTNSFRAEGNFHGDLLDIRSDINGCGWLSLPCFERSLFILAQEHEIVGESAVEESSRQQEITTLIHYGRSLCLAGKVAEALQCFQRALNLNIKFHGKEKILVYM